MRRVLLFFLLQRTPYNHSEALYKRHALVRKRAPLAPLVASLLVVFTLLLLFVVIVCVQTIKEYLRSRALPELRNKRDHALLQEFVLRWDNHKVMNRWMQRFFMYLVSALYMLGLGSTLCQIA